MHQKNSISAKGAIKAALLFIAAGFGTGIGIALILGSLTLLAASTAEAANLQATNMSDQKGLSITW